MAANFGKNNRLKLVMETLGVGSRDLSRLCGVDHSLIARWVKGARPLTRRSGELPEVAKALARLDSDGITAELTAPYRQRGEGPERAMYEYLLGEDVAGFRPGAAAAKQRTSGEYEVRYRVFLGQKGFHKVAYANADYLAALPPGTELVALCQGNYEWFIGSIPFLLRFAARLRVAVGRGNRFLVIIRKGYTVAETALFTGPWLLFHLRGYIRSRYYDDALPEGVRFAASIPGYLGTWIEEDPEMEDSLYAELHTDPRSMRRSEQVVAQYRAKSRPSSQYGFLRHPMGGPDNPRLWREGPLPSWENGDRPDGSFYALSGLPGFGVITKTELAQIAGGGKPPLMPDYLFREHEAFAPGPHRIILCREDIREALAVSRKLHKPLSALLGRKAYVPREMLAEQLRRLLAAMDQRGDFRVALVPRVAFEKIQMEMICWKNSVSVAWLQDMENSVFADDAPTSGSFHGFLSYVWDKLLAGWKRPTAVSRQLRKWLAGKELDKREEDSAIVKNWDVMPGE